MIFKCSDDCFQCPYPDCVVGVEYVFGAERERILARQLEVLRPVRIAAGLSQRQLARRLNMNKATISSWERGKVVAKWDALCAVLPELEKYRP